MVTKILLIFHLIFQEIKARRHRASTLARIQQHVAYLTFQEQIPPDAKAHDQHTPCCGPIPIQREHEAFLIIQALLSSDEKTGEQQSLCWRSTPIHSRKEC